MKYKDWITQWLHFYVRPTVKQRTFEHYEGVARRQLIPCLGGYELDALRPAVLQAFTAGAGGGPATSGGATPPACPPRTACGRRAVCANPPRARPVHR